MVNIAKLFIGVVSAALGLFSLIAVLALKSEEDEGAIGKIFLELKTINCAIWLLGGVIIIYI